MIRAVFPVIKQTFVKIFNKLLETGNFTSSWTEGIIVPIRDPNNYKGNTLNSCLGKLFRHVMNSRISNYLESMSFFFFLFLLQENKQGFAKNFRTTDQIFIIKTIVDIW